MKNYIVIKKDGTRQKYNYEKVKNAVLKSADRGMVELTEKDLEKIKENVENCLKTKFKDGIISVQDMHKIVELSLDIVSKETARQYRDYRNYKTEFVGLTDTVYKETQKISFLGDKENSNTDSALVSTKRCLIYNVLNKELYKKFFLRKDELEAIHDGYIYIHDMSARRDSINCCLADISSILKGGFEMGNVWYNEPKYLDTVFDVMGDIILSMSAQQYGGFTVPEVDSILLPYAEKSYALYIDEYYNMVEDIKPDYDLDDYRYKAHDYAIKKIERDLMQGFQGLEYKLNTVASSRGDYPSLQVALYGNI